MNCIVQLTIRGMPPLPRSLSPPFIHLASFLRITQPHFLSPPITFSRQSRSLAPAPPWHTLTVFPLSPPLHLCTISSISITIFKVLMKSTLGFVLYAAAAAGIIFFFARLSIISWHTVPMHCWTIAIPFCCCRHSFSHKC